MFDIFTFALIAGGCGFVVFALVQRANPLLRWGNHGNVYTGVIAPWDLLVAVAFLAFYYGQACMMLKAPVAVGEIHVSGIAAGLLWQILLGGALVFYLGFLRRIDLGEFFGVGRLSIGKVALWSVGGVLLVGYPLVLVGAYINGALVERAGFEPESQLAVQLLQSSDSLTLQILLVISAVVAAPLSEEIIFRGFLYPVFKAFTDRFFAIFISAIFFAVVHNDLGTVLPLFALGVCFAVAFELTGCLWVPIGMHAVFNLVNVGLVRFAEPLAP